MIERVIDYSVRNPVVIVMLAIGILCWGMYATIQSPVDAIPDLSENQVIVFADWPGRSPQEIEDQVTYPLSVNLQGLAGVKAVRATSEFGFSMVNIIFDEKVDFYFARERILERLSTATSLLPAGVQAYLAPDATAVGQIFWYTVEGSGSDLGQLRAIQDWFVRYQLASVPGVAEVASVGGFPIEYQIDVDPAKLRSFNVTLGELYSAVARSNASVGGGVIQKGTSEYLVRSAGWITSLADVEQTVVKSIRGVPVQVGDVATVQFGSAPRRSVLEKNGSEAVGGVVLMRYGENPLEVTKRVRQKIEQLHAGLPDGVRIVPFYDRTRLINDAIHTVTRALIEEGIVASLVIFLILWHLRSALIICVMLPMAVLISFILMRQFGISSNIMSLSGIAISIGVLVDAAIVMVDQGAHTLHEHFGNLRVRGDTRELLLPALRTVGRPVFFSLAIMLLSFVPVFMLTGMEGKMFHPLAFTKTFALLGVAILAITFVPAVIPWVMRGRIRHEEESWIVRRVIEVYRPVLNFLMDHPWPVAWTVSVICLLGSIPTGSIVAFYAALILSLGLAAWSAWGETGSFRRHWKWVFLMWFLSIGGTLTLAILNGWQPDWLPATFVSGRWQFIGIALGTAATTCFVAVWTLARLRVAATVTIMGSLIVVALIGQQTMRPLGREFMPPLNEGSILDMPITIPRASATQSAADLKTRNAQIRAFPEVESVVGKAGRAETPTDPAPLDMVETIVNLRDREFWPKRELRFADAQRQTESVVSALQADGMLKESLSQSQFQSLVNDSTMLAIDRFDATMRLGILQEITLFEQQLGTELIRFTVDEFLQQLRGNGTLTVPVSASTVEAICQSIPAGDGQTLVRSLDATQIESIALKIRQFLVDREMVTRDADLFAIRDRAAMRALRFFAESLGMERSTMVHRLLESVTAERNRQWSEFSRQLDWRLLDQAAQLFTNLAIEQVLHRAGETGQVQREPSREETRQVLDRLTPEFSKRLMLWKRDRSSLLAELDSNVRMPGWGNIWTQPIINRIDMLATGVNTMLGVRVFGSDMQQIAAKCEEIATLLKRLRGAVDVSADQIVGEGYLEIDIDRERAARYGVSVGDIQDVIETALGGRIVTTTVEGRERFPVRIRYARAFREDEESVKNLLVSGSRLVAQDGDRPGSQNTENRADKASPSMQIPLSELAEVRIVSGPSMIRSENGLLRSYVRLNVRDRDIIGFVDEARKAVASEISMPPGMYVEWTGQFEHQVRAGRTLAIILPMVVLSIFLLLYIVYHDLADTLVVLCLTVPGAVFGGVLFQYLFGYNFSVAVWIGYIACFGLATEGGLVILVYLRQAVERRGGLENMSLAELRTAVMDGAVHRLRPKLMTELTTMIGLAPMLWATGTGAEIMQPMAAPVLGGILVADEVVDLLLPVLFYHVRARRWKRIHASD